MDPIQLGLHRLPLPEGASFEQRVARNRWMLSRALHFETLVAVVGNGPSRALGYPSWAGFVEDVVTRAAARGADGGHGLRGDLERLQRFQRTLESGRALATEELTLFLGAAVEVLERTERGGNVYHTYLKDRFGQTVVDVAEELDPYRALTRLPIRRFVTTNYDCELERQLLSPIATDVAEVHAKLRAESNGGPTLVHSFCQRVEDHAWMAAFVARSQRRDPPQVFHCHGRFDRPETILATERDYRNWYLGEQPEHIAFRQTMELVFTSSPILFVGYGLEERDVLRVLRKFVQTHPEGKQARPRFALLPLSDDDDGRNRAEILYETYGLHVIPYPAREDPEEHTKELIAALDRIRADLEVWRAGRLEKPIIRDVQVVAAPPDPYIHHEVGTDTRPVLAQERMEEELAELREAALGEAKVVVLLGKGGAGKSFLAHQLIDRLKNERDLFDGFFFWSSYYSDDAITGIDRLLRYLDPDGELKGGRFKRLSECLRSGRYLVVFDGFERLLFHDEEDPPEIGRASAASIRKFLELAVHEDVRSTVLLTTRLWPQELSEAENDHQQRVRRRRLRLLQTDDIRDVEPFRSHERADVSALCSLLDGHTYGLVLAGRYLQANGAGTPGERMRTLRAKLARALPDRRVTEMIRTTLGDLEETHGEILTQFLQRISFFMSPVPEAMLRLCYELALEHVEAPREEDGLQELLQELLYRHLLFRVRPGPGEPSCTTYTVHPTVRGYIFYRIHHAATEELPNFTLPGFTSGTGYIDPGNAGALVVEMVGRLTTYIESVDGDGHRSEAVELCRSLLGVLRSRMEAITAPRWTAYQEYVRPGFRFLDLIRRLSPRTWSHADPHDRIEVSGPDGVLYADELAWLYNDLGLSCCGEGRFEDTYELWDQGYDINQVIEPDEGTNAYGDQWRQYVVQSLLHLGHTFIELGDLDSAQQYLTLTEAENERLGDSDYKARVVGYRALIAHLEDDLSEANRLYENALRQLYSDQRNPRARSFFLIHHANLQIDLGQYDDAERSLRDAQSLAEGKRYPDLVGYAHCGRGHLFRSRKRFVRARDELDRALGIARKRGIERLTADATSQLARLALALKDHRAACQLAVDGMAWANRLNLGLRQTRGLVVLGLSANAFGLGDLGARYLEQARAIAEKQHYWSRMHEAERQLAQLARRTAGASLELV